MTNFAGASLLIGLCVVLAVRMDLRRRHLSLLRGEGWNLSRLLDVSAMAIAVTTVAALASSATRPLLLAASILIAAFLWSEGLKQVQLQRPDGLVVGEYLVLAGACFAFLQTEARLVWRVSPVFTGVAVIGVQVFSFLHSREEHLILERISQQGEFIQPEWIQPTPECPFPEQWSMLDAQSAEVEVLDFLKSLVRTVKPNLIVETGTFIGHSAIKMAEAIKENGFGRIVTVEYDPKVYAKAQQNIDDSGLADWIEARNGSSLEMTVAGTIDLLYSDSDISIREQEVRRFLPQVKPRGLVLIHDASSSFGTVREAALRLEREGLLSVVLLSTPRGLVIAQKKEAVSNESARKDE